ncbi:hypothetical protein NBRC116596_29560 [Litorivita sp. NS0012-18]
MVDECVAWIMLFQMGELCKDLFADKYPIPPVVFHLMCDGDKLVRTLEEGG